MYTFVWELGLTGYSSCLRSVGSAFKPVFAVNTLKKMQHPRKFGKYHAMSRPYREDNNYGYNNGNETYKNGYDTLSDMRERRYDSWEGENGASKWPSQTGSVGPRFLNKTCADLKPSEVGCHVRMTGRVQYQRINRFISLRDSHGVVQLVATDERSDLIKIIRDLPIDSYIEITGVVKKRPLSTINHSMATGQIEVILESIDVIVAGPKRKRDEPREEETTGRTGKKARSSALLTSVEIARCETPAVKRKFQQRTHNCGELRTHLKSKDVILCGWVESIRNERFAVLRDGYGTAQIVISPNEVLISSIMQKIDVNTLVLVMGKVRERPTHQINTRMATGEIEVQVNYMEIVDPNEPEPVPEASNQNTKSEAEESSGPAPGSVNSYSARTHTCGQLRGGEVGCEVVMCGWLDSHRGNRFGTIRDGHGYTQLLIPSELVKTVGKEMGCTPLESVIRVAGTVCARPPEQISDKIPTGEIEILVKEFTVINPAKSNLPFVIRDHNRPKEPMRMKYRYLDLRYSDMQYRLRLRSKVMMQMRNFLTSQRGFVEVETPTLFRRTPGGAQEYVVPTRTEDQFYSLVQSPQQLKQLLMVGAIDRYFQVARCYRDEGARPDRQPEFTQMDLELSFTDRESIMALIEDLLKASWPEELKSLQTPFPVLTYHDAIHNYGTDKPDLSLTEHKLIDISELVTDDKKTMLPENLRDLKNLTAKVLVVGPNSMMQKMTDSFKECEELQKKKPNMRAKLIKIECYKNKWEQALQEDLPFLDSQKLKSKIDFPIPSTIILGIGKENDVLPLLGKLRQDVFGGPTSQFHFAWIVDFPLFLEGEDGGLESTHHPFTQPHPDDAHLMDSDPLKVRGLHFDLVLNGFEVGGGSVRVHDHSMQKQILQDKLKIPTSSLEHLLEALSSGAPPHGGIALGMDRLLAVMLGAESIRDVIAFPKGADGKDPLCGAPCTISDEEKRLYHLLPRAPKLST